MGIALDEQEARTICVDRGVWWCWTVLSIRAAAPKAVQLHEVAWPGPKEACSRFHRTCRFPNNIAGVTAIASLLLSASKLRRLGWMMNESSRYCRPSDVDVVGENKCMKE